MYSSPIVLLKGIKGTFWKLLQNMPESTFNAFIFNAKSTSNKEQYWIPSALPSIKEWITSITYEDMADDYLEVVNKKWMDGIQVDRDTLSDTEISSNVQMWIKSMANLYNDFQDELCQSLLSDNATAFDGTAAFATSRPNLDTGSNTINNLYSGTLSSAYTTSTFSADYAGARAALFGLRDKNNRAFNKKGQLVVLVPQHLEDMAQQILNDRADFYIDAATTDPKSNIYKSTAEIVINWEQGSSDNDFYIINKAAMFPPFLIQDRESLSWEMKDDQELTFIKYWLHFRMGYSILNPMSIIKINN